MDMLVLGLVLFFGIHMVRIVAGPWRSRQIERMGAMPWKGIYSVISLAGFGLMLWGYGQTRAAPELVLMPLWTRPLAALLTLPAFVLLVAAYVPRNHFKAALGHPMLASVKLWSLAHLLCNMRLGDVLLFGSFLAWSVLAFVASRRRDRADGVRYSAGTLGASALVLALGVGAWAWFAMVGHGRLIGIRPFG
jgi:uncharacterized membrane protein